MSNQGIIRFSRASSLLFGVLALGALFVGWYYLDAPFGKPVPILFQPLFLVIVAACLFRAAWVAWFRWSPLAVRHVVGTLFFFVTIGLCSIVHPALALFVLIFCYVAYRLTSGKIARIIFATDSAVATGSNSQST